MARYWIFAALLALQACSNIPAGHASGPCAGGENTIDCQVLRYSASGM